jgi:hypothetical protein
MTHEQFIVWLHGFFEISEAKELNEKQTQIIKDHLNLFFNKQTPNRENIIIGHQQVSCTCDPNMSTFNVFCPVHGTCNLTPYTYNPNQIIC